MVFGITWRCKYCNYEVIITDDWEFYIDKSGNRRRYSHPVPVLKEALKGVRGFSADLYCPKCKDIKDVIIEEFGKAITRGYPATSFDVDGGKIDPVCDTCGTKLKKSLDDSDVCPKCNLGTFKFYDLWVS